MVLTELLAPAGSYDILVVAINAGADAVYIAGQRYGARAFAQNFTSEEIEQAVNYAHLNGASVHVTVNTLFNSKEILEVLKYIQYLPSAIKPIHFRNHFSSLYFYFLYFILCFFFS